MPSPTELAAYRREPSKLARSTVPEKRSDLVLYATRMRAIIEENFPTLLTEVDGVIVLATGGTGDFSEVKAAAGRAVFAEATIFRFSKTMPDPAVPNGDADRASLLLYSDSPKVTEAVVVARGATRDIPGEVLSADLSEVMTDFSIQEPLLLITGNLAETLFQATQGADNGFEAFKDWLQCQPLGYVLIDCVYVKNDDGLIQVGQLQTRALDAILPEDWWLHSLNNQLLLMSRDGVLFNAEEI
jgi:hypothetical protein